MKLSKKEIGLISLILAILAVFIVSKFKNNDQGYNNNFEKVESVNESTINNNENIYVHIAGAVKNPGLVIMDSNSRVMDAINCAGGTLEEADIDKINLAKKLNDEDRIYIPEKSESTENSDYNEVENNQNKLININTANSEELQTPPGIGPKMADNIIEYRNNQNFKTIDDIKNVKGIGDKKFRDLEKFICIN